MQNQTVKLKDGRLAIVQFQTNPSTYMVLVVCLLGSHAQCMAVPQTEIEPHPIAFTNVSQQLPPRNRRILVIDKHADCYPFSFTGTCNVALSAQWFGIEQWAEILENI